MTGANVSSILKNHQGPLSLYSVYSMQASSSATASEYTLEDIDSYEWEGMNFEERAELLQRKRDDLEEFENEVQHYCRSHELNEWNERYLDRATKTSFYYLRIIDKLEQTLIV